MIEWREEVTVEVEERRASAFLQGASKMSARVTSRLPKWVAEERRGRSGQGQEVMSERSLGRDQSISEKMTQDDTEARKSGKDGDDGESRGDVRDMKGRHCQVIRKSKTFDVGEGGEGSKEGVIGKNKNERGEGATLLDPP